MAGPHRPPPSPAPTRCPHRVPPWRADATGGRARSPRDGPGPHGMATSPVLARDRGLAKLFRVGVSVHDGAGLTRRESAWTETLAPNP